jgi:hypothetical protein
VNADQANLPLAILLLGAAAVCGFLAVRAWPQSSGAAIKPGAYVVDVLHGTPPPAGPPAFSSGEVALTETGLSTLVGIWAAGKAAGALKGLGSAAGGMSGLLNWMKNLGEDAGEGAEDAA